MPPTQKGDQVRDPAPDALDVKRAELEIEQEILKAEVEALKTRVLTLVKNLKSHEQTIARGEDPNPSGEKYTPEALKSMLELSESMKESLKSVKQQYVTKSKELQQLDRTMKSLTESPADVHPSASPADSMPPGDRLADFDRQIHLLQQKRDAYLMSLPDDERQALLKQLTP